MAKLKQRKDGGYYLSQGLLGGRSVKTWQVSEEGWALLQSSGCRAGETVPKHIFNQLKDSKLIFTGGSGIHLNEPANIVSATLLKGSQGSQPPLTLWQREGGWELAIMLPEIPGALMRSIDNDFIDQELPTCAILVDDVRVSAIWLWPGNGGQRHPVLPRLQPYVVSPSGPWPTQWNADQWLCSVDGLDEAATFFVARDDCAERLPPGAVLRIGQRYNVVMCAPKRPPVDVVGEMEAIGLNGQWAAWAFTLRATTDTSALACWLKSLGYVCREWTWRLSVVSPLPERYLADGLAVFAASQEVIVAATPPEHGMRHLMLQLEVGGVPAGTIELQAKQKNDGRSICYLAVSTAAPGMYRIRADSSYAEPLAWAMDEAASEPTHFPQIVSAALKVTITGSEIVVVDGIMANDDEYEIISADGPPLLVAEAPVPLTVRWGYTQLKHRRVVAAAAVAELLAEHIARTYTDRSVLHIEIDGGAFGRVRLSVRAPQPAADRQLDTTLPARLEERARWIEQLSLGMAGRAHARMAVLPPSVIAILRRAAPGSAPQRLAALGRVPHTLLPHALALTHEISSSFIVPV